MSDQVNQTVSKDRPFLLIDETRFSCGSGCGQLTLFAIIQTNYLKARLYFEEMASIREKIRKPNLKKKAFKGSELLRTSRPDLQLMKVRVLEELRHADNIVYFITHSEETNKLKGNPICGFDTIPHPEAVTPTGRIDSPELFLVCTVVKQIALNQKFGKRQVDVIIDRSKYLDLDPDQRKISKDSFQIIGTTTFNGCASQFRILSSSDKGTVRDLLLLPDLAAYAARREIEERISALCSRFPSTVPYEMWVPQKHYLPWLPEFGSPANFSATIS